MKTLLKPALAAGLAFAAMAPLAAPAQAQVAGIATSSPEAVMVRSAARIAAYQLINTTYAAQIQQLGTYRQEMQTLQQGLDADSNGQLTQAEIDANPSVRGQIEAKQAQMDTLTQPIAMAQYYVIEQLINDYGNAQTQVIQAKNIQIMLTPEVFQFAADGVDVTGDILAVVDQRLPTVATTPPQTFRPRQNTVETHRAVQQIIFAAAQRAAAAQQQAAPAAQPAPSGR
jgi:Skp family chaperone for outer membrane proteins